MLAMTSKFISTCWHFILLHIHCLALLECSNKMRGRITQCFSILHVLPCFCCYNLIWMTSLRACYTTEQMYSLVGVVTVAVKQ